MAKTDNLHVGKSRKCYTVMNNKNVKISDGNTFKTKQLALVALALFLILSGISAAFPPVPSEYYGTVEINGQPAQAGTVVLAYDKSGIKCGSFEVRDAGKYGFLSCKGDDPVTQEDEGALQNEEIIFYVKGKLASKSGSSKWLQGSFNELNLTFQESGFSSEKSITSAQENSAGDASRKVMKLEANPAFPLSSVQPSPKAGSEIGALEIIVVSLILAGISLFIASRGRP